MSNIFFTEEQSKAIYSKNADILVAAAAGSGKTAVLVERIINIISDVQNPVDIDKMLIVTFTDAAANEMKQRISAAISKLLEKNPNDEHLLRQSLLVNRANISTIHSFCSKVIRQNFNQIDIDPAFRIADKIEIMLIKQQLISELFENEYANEDNQLFFDLVEFFGDKIHDDSFVELFLRIYEFSVSNPWPEEFIKSAAEKFDLSGVESLDETIWAKIIKEDISVRLEYMLRCLEIMEKICKMPGGPEKYLENIVDDRLVLESTLKYTKKSLDCLYENLDQFKPVRLKTIKANELDSEELKEKFKRIRDKEIKDDITDIKKKYFFKSPEEMLEDIKKIYPLMNYLSELVVKFSKAFTQMKREKNILDFNDLEHFCLQILLEEGSNENNIRYSKAAVEFQNKFHEILIDEYQDINYVQELILSSVSKKHNRFMVGDIKQSIYRFRRARPELFIQKYNSYSEKDGDDNLKIDLYRNFRSRKSVINSINFIFYQIMSQEVGEVFYNESQALYAGAEYLENEKASGATEIILIEDKFKGDIDEGIEELHKIELEAHIVAKRILELKEKSFVQEKGEQRPVKFSDIVILVRSIESTGETFTEILKKYDIPVYANTNNGFFDSLEVLTILSFLQIIDNPRQDIDLITVLHSPVYAFSADELLEIRSTSGTRPIQQEKLSAKKAMSFYDCLKQYNSKPEIKSKINRFLNDLNHWRELRVFTPINEIIFKIYDETNYYDYVGVMQGGNIRQANLRALQEKAVEFEATSLKSLFHFVKYIERIQKINNDIGNAKIISENENLVRMMTVHKSKGLEFPIVFVSLLGKEFNFKDEKNKLNIHHELGFGPVYLDLENRIRSNTIAKIAVNKKMRKESVSEEMRIFYTALTRAKEKLILSGTISNLTKKTEDYRLFEDYTEKTLPPYYLLKSRNFLDFLMPAVFRHKDFNSGNIFYNKEIYDFDTKFEIKYYSQNDVFEDAKEEADNAKILYENLQNIEYNQNAEEIKNKLSWVYKFDIEQKLPTKVNISEIKRAYTEEENEFDEEVAFDIPSFILEKEEIKGASFGVLIHKVLENLDITHDTNIEKIKTLLYSLLKKNILTEKEVLAVPINKILKFVNSEIAERIRNSDTVKRETPFVLGLSPKEIYPDSEIEDEKILVHGIIDCFFEEKGEIIIVDYKTDHAKKDEIKERYKTQMSIYKKAVERSTGKKVSEVVLYLFGNSETVNYDV